MVAAMKKTILYFAEFYAELICKIIIVLSIHNILSFTLFKWDSSFNSGLKYFFVMLIVFLFAKCVYERIISTLVKNRIDFYAKKI